MTWQKSSQIRRLLPPGNSLVTELNCVRHGIASSRVWPWWWNAMVIVIALGGSTNAVLHIIAMAHSVGITLTLEDFQAVSDKTPFLVGPARYYSPRHPTLLNLRLLSEMASHDVASDIRHIVYRCSPCHPPHSLPVLTTSSATRRFLS